MQSLLCDKLNDATSFLDLALSFGRDVSCLDDYWCGWETALSENLCVTEGEEVEDGGGVAALAGEIFLALFGWDETPELGYVSIERLGIIEEYLPCRG